MSSSTSVATATAASTAGSSNNVNPKNSNKMKLDMPPRPSKVNSRRQAAAASGGSAAGNLNAKPKNSATGAGGGKEDGSVPHVVRVTFLGVAGLLAKPSSHSSTNNDGGDNKPTDENNELGDNKCETTNESSNNTDSKTTTTPASSNHPTLLFPLPANLRVVACVSRSRTARGIPSGMSNCISSPSNNKHNEQQRQQQNNSIVVSPITTTTLANGTTTIASPMAGESIIMEKQQHQKTPNRSRNRSGSASSHAIDEISITRDQSTGLEVFDEDGTTKSGHASKGSGGGPSQQQPQQQTSASSFGMDVFTEKSLAPPSQVLQHGRTGSSTTSSALRRKGSGCATGENGGGGGSVVRSHDSIGPSTNTKSNPQEDLEGGGGEYNYEEEDTGEQIEGIEVIRPYSPTGGEGSQTLKNCGEGEKKKNPKLKEQRLVAVWDEGGNGSKKSQTTSEATTASATQQQQQQSVKQTFVNNTNSLAFEAELHPSSAEEEEGGDDGGNKPSTTTTPLASTTFAPKSFCVTVGLVPDFDMIEGQQQLQGSDEKTINEGGGGSDNSAITPAFAIPVGFADLVINGDETLDGKRKQIDLPLSSIGNFLAMFGGGSGSNAGGEKGGLPKNNPFPLIELTAQGLASSANKVKDDAAAAKIAAGGKMKKKSIVKRMFSRKHSSSATTASTGDSTDATAPSTIYSGTQPLSIFQLGRPPNLSERSLFLDRYGVDPLGDAVIRVGLEVFPRGSDLERVFRQKNKLRKKAAADTTKAGGASRARRSPNLSVSVRRNQSASSGRYSPGSRTIDTNDSRSLMDDEYDETDMDSDYDDDSMFDQSFFTMDSGASQTTWDESTMYTDGLSSFNTFGDDDTMSYTTGFTNGYEQPKYEDGKSPRGDGSKKNAGNFFVNLLNCQGPSSMVCGDEEEIRRTNVDLPPYANIDAVASAVASMSMVGPIEERAEVSTPRAMGRTPKAEMGHIRSDASIDTASRGNFHKAASPDSVAESSEELALDLTVGAPRPAPVNTTIPLEDKTLILENESTPLATIKQRFTVSDDENDKPEEGVREEEIGTEFTLEEHRMGQR